LVHYTCKPNDGINASLSFLVSRPYKAQISSLITSSNNRQTIKFISKWWVLAAVETSNDHLQSNRVNPKCLFHCIGKFAHTPVLIDVGSSLLNSLHTF